MAPISFSHHHLGPAHGTKRCGLTAVGFSIQPSWFLAVFRHLLRRRIVHLQFL